MLYIIFACAGAYLLLLGAEFIAVHFGGMRRPWLRLRLLVGTVGAIILILSAANWSGIIPAEASRQDYAQIENRIPPAELDWLSTTTLRLPERPKFEPLTRYPKDASPSAGQHPDIQWYIHYYSEIHRVDPLLVRAIIRVESGFDPFAVSHRGAMGLMQINRITAKHLGLKNPFDIRQNIEGGTRYLKMLLKRQYWDLHRTLASYNAGPGAVDRFGGIPPYPETRRYVWKVLAEYRKLKRLTEVFRAKRPSPPARQPQALKTRPSSGEAAG